MHTHTHRVGPVCVSRVDGLQRFIEGLGVLFVQNALRLFIGEVVKQKSVCYSSGGPAGVLIHTNTDV